MKKILLIVVGLVVLLIAALLIGRNVIASNSVEAGVEKTTGFPLEVGSMDVGLFQSKIEARNVKLKNPPDFKDPLFVEMPRLYVDYRLGSMLGKEPHLNQLDVELDRIVIVKNEQGETNVKRLKGARGEKETPDTGEKMKYQVDTLSLKIGTVVYKDYSGKTPTERSFPLNIQETYHDINDGTDINRLVLMTVLRNVSLPDIGLNIGDLAKNLGNVKNASGEVIKGVIGVFESTGKEAGEVLEKGKDIVDKFKGLIPGEKK